MRAALLLGLVVAPACAALSLPDGPLAWYVADAALVVCLLAILQHGKPLRLRLVCWLGMLVHAVAAGYGLAAESGAVSAGGLWLLLGAFALVAEMLVAGDKPWPQKSP